MALTVPLAVPASAQITRLSVGPGNVEANGPSYDVALSRSAAFAVFSSDASNLVGGDTNGVRDVFVRDIAGGVTTRVSVATDGTERTAPSGAPDITNVLPFTQPGTGGLAISDDGNVVAFVSRAAFDAADAQPCANGDTTEPCWKIYVRDRAAGTTTRVSIATDGTQANGHSVTPRLSADGRYVLFESSATISWWAIPTASATSSCTIASRTRPRA